MIFRLIIIILCFVSTLQAQSNKELETVTLQLSWHHQFQFAGYYAALEKGFYREAGLDVIIKPVVRGQNMTNEIVSGRAQYGTCRTSILLDRILGQPVVYIAAIFQHSSFVVISNKKSNIKTPQDLFNKRVMVFTPFSLLKAMLIEEGVALDDVEFIAEDFSIDKLFNGDVDALTGDILNTPYYDMPPDFELNYIEPTSYGLDFYGDGLFTSEQELDNHPDRVGKFYEASMDGWKYALNNIEEISELIAGSYNQNLTREQLMAEAEIIKSLVIPKIIQVGHVNHGRWEHIAETYAELGLIESGYTLDGFLFKPGGEHLPEWFFRALYTSGIFLFLVSIGLTGLLIFNRRLKRAERALATERARLSNILNGTNAGTWDWYVQTGEIVLNERWAEIMGYKLEELEPTDIQTWIKNVHPADLPNANVMLEKHFNGEADYYDAIFRQLHKDGSWVWINARGKVVEWTENGKPRRMSGTHLNITERKRAEEEILEQSTFLQIVLESLNQPFFVVNTKDYKVELANTAAMGSSYFEGITCHELSHNSNEPCNSPEHQCPIYEILETKKPIICEHTHYDSSGRSRIIEIHGFPIFDKNGDVEKIIENSFDITERKHLEKQLQIRQRMDSLGTLAGGIAHDFNNILVGIMGNIDLMNFSNENLSENQKQLVGKAVESCERASKLIQQFQTMSKGANEPDSRLDIYDISDEAFTILKTTTDKLIDKQIKFKKGEFFVTAVPMEINQVLLNLGNNSVEAIEERGAKNGDYVRISAENYEATTDDRTGLAEGDYIHITFEDNGAGMSDEIVSQAFDPLFTTKDKFSKKGQGLGLAMVYNIVTRKCKGHIHIESEKSQGTTFHIYLPQA